MNPHQSLLPKWIMSTFSLNATGLHYYYGYKNYLPWSGWWLSAYPKGPEQVQDVSQ